MSSELDPSKACVIIPAFNEAKHIKATLEHIGASKHSSFHIIVSCNGCTDNTAAIVKEYFPHVFVLETTQASKALAIRAAESQPLGFPRVYMDADILLDEKSIEALIAACHQANRPNLVVPQSNTVFNGSTRLVKAYYREWYRSHFVQKIGFGCGVYALSKQARHLFGEWPELIADDNFIRCYFSEKELCISPAAISHVQAPKNIKQLIAIKARSKYGNIELKNYMTEHQQPLPLKFAAHPAHARFDYLVYFVVNIAANLYAKHMYRNRTFSWLRDHSNH